MFKCWLISTYITCHCHTSNQLLFYRQISELNLFVRCGDWDIHGIEEMHPHQDRNVRYKIIHPLYTGTRGTSEKVNYNFAVLHLEKDFDLDVHINPICLPDIPDKKTGTYTTSLVANCHMNTYNIFDKPDA